MTDDHDGRERDWPDEAPADQQERQAARELGEAVDRLLAGEWDEAAGDELKTAAMIRASVSEQSLGRERRDALIAGALDAARNSPRRRWRASLTAVALAASLLLCVGAAVMLWSSRAPRRYAAPNAALQPRALSRGSDPLMGRPFTDRANASGRLDLVYADRLAGYRQVLLARGGP